MKNGNKITLITIRPKVKPVAMIQNVKANSTMFLLYYNKILFKNQKVKAVDKMKLNKVMVIKKR